jgi:hypothetical protein
MDAHLFGKAVCLLTGLTAMLSSTGGTVEVSPHI